MARTAAAFLSLFYQLSFLVDLLSNFYFVMESLKFKSTCVIIFHIDSGAVFNYVKVWRVFVARFSI